jgi:hypothetical protein
MKTQSPMSDTDLLTALSFLKIDDRKMVEKIVQMLILGKKVELVEKDERKY